MSNVARFESADARPDVALARAFNPDTIAAQAEELRKLKRENAILRVRAERNATLRAALLSWILENARDIVFDHGDEPELMQTLADRSEWERLGKYIESSLSGCGLPRLRCSACRTAGFDDVRCTGCNGHSDALPPRIARMLADLRKQERDAR